MEALYPAVKFVLYAIGAYVGLIAAFFLGLIVLAVAAVLADRIGG